ncbi:MAG TPA: hypothetical protein VH500_02285 [Nitrososphaeraceae archaeon]|jgi:hypothetical protein
MNNKTTYTIVAIATLAALLITTTAASNAYAGGHGHHNHYSKTKQSQSLAQANVCGNGKFPVKVDCQNAGSQIQGKRNTAAVAAEQ